jgi:hypothetical protein
MEGQTDMVPKRTRKRARGQSLVEYSLTIALVAFAAIVLLLALGLAVQRIFGVTVAALGSKFNTAGRLEIESAQCIASLSLHQTGLVVYGNTNEDLANLVASSEMTVGTSLDGSFLAITPNGSAPNSFLLNRVFAYQADIRLCPKTIVIQAKDGAIAVKPLETVIMN